MDHFAFVQEPFDLEMEKVASVPIQAGLDTDISIIKEAGVARGPFGATLAACDYLDRIIYQDRDDDLTEVFDKVASAALEADVEVLNEEFCFDLPEECHAEMRRSIAKVAAELAKAAAGFKPRFARIPRPRTNTKLPGPVEMYRAKTVKGRAQIYKDKKRLQEPARRAYYNQPTRVRATSTQRAVGDAAESARAQAIIANRKKGMAASMERMRAAERARQRLVANTAPSREKRQAENLSRIREMERKSPIADSKKLQGSSGVSTKSEGFEADSSVQSLNKKIREREAAGGAVASSKTTKTTAPPPPKKETAPPPPKKETAPREERREQRPRQEDRSEGGAPSAPPAKVPEGLSGTWQRFNSQGWGALSSAEKGKLIAAGLATVGGHRVLTGRDVLTGERSGGGGSRGPVVVA